VATRNGNCDALQFEANRRHTSRSGLFLAKFVPLMRRKMPFPSFRSNCWDRRWIRRPCFLHGTNIWQSMGIY